MMFLVKMERNVMWVSSRYIFLVLSVCFASQSFCQVKNAWGFELSPGISNSKMASGYGIGYPDSPYYVNLKIRTPSLFSFRVEVFKSRTTKKNWYFSKAIGFSSYSYILYYDYDRQASIANNVSDRYDFQFIYGIFRAGKSFHIKKTTLTGFGGITANYLIKAKVTSDYVYSKGGSHNRLGEVTRLAFGWELGVSCDFPLNEKINFQIRPSMNKILKNYDHDARRFYSFGIGFAITKEIAPK